MATRKRRTPEQVVRKLAQADRMLGEGKDVADAYHDAEGEGWHVKHKKIQRLWREEGLRVPSGATTHGRPIKIVSVVDEHTANASAGWSSARSPAMT